MFKIVSLYKKAFTLIEIMVVVTIIAIILILTFPAYETIQVRARLQNSADMVAQTLNQARTLSTSGYQERKGSGAAVIGVAFEKENDTITLFSSKLQDDSRGVSITSTTIIDTYLLRGMGVTELLADGNHDLNKVSVLFVPPFGLANIQTGNAGDTSFTRLTIRVGSGKSANSGLSKTIDFFAGTNRIEYDYDQKAAGK